MTYLDVGILLAKIDSAIDGVVAKLKNIWINQQRIDWKLLWYPCWTPYTKFIMKLFQPRFTDKIAKYVQLSSKVCRRQTPTVLSRIFKRFKRAPSYKGYFDYQLIVGELSFMEREL